MSKDISITALATDEEINRLWEIVGEILDRNNIYSDDELIVRVRSYENE
tara:strand:- start:812 stop:958 length:147 start_codon:yes stop_codon:yes gene_type:complete